MAVNVSALEFRDEHFLEKLFRVLDETGMDPQLLELEITESVLMKHAESARRHLTDVAGSGGASRP
jgi:EAL domain-containing protein (putative c-di-GMP-specific phosphodiesterase class I)